MWPFLQTTSNTCGCEQSDYNQCGCNKTSSNDISYNGPALVCTEIALCDSLTVALQKIEAKICSAGTVSGSGTNNYIPKWTPNGTTLGNSQMRDDGVTFGVGTFYGSPLSKFSIESNLTNYISNNTINATTSYVGLNAGVSDNTNVPKNNYTGTGIFGYANSSTTQNIGVSGSGSGVNATLNIGVYGSGIATLNNPCITSLGGKFEAGFGTNNYAVQLIDGTQGIGKVLTCMTADGKANWVTPTTGVAGSGTTNYVARWTPNGTTLGIGLIRDDNTSVGINAIPDSVYRLTLAGNALNGLYTYTTRVATGSDTAIGVNSSSYGVSALGENVGVLGTAANNTNINYGVYGGCSSPTTGKNVGLRGVASGGAAGTYAIQLQDGTQAAGKFLKSITNNGEANWANITSSDTTGATGTFTSQDGKTITVTNGLITSIV